ncbi:MAG: sensor histidine kinase [Flavonifractor plautii]
MPAPVRLLHALRLPRAPGRLPEFQTCATAVLLAAWLAAGALSTRHFAGLLRRDAALLTAATGAIAARRLDLPLDGGARVRELGRAWPLWSSSGRPWPGLCPSSGPWSRSAPRRWPPWPTTSRPPVHRQRQRGAAGGGRPLPAQRERVDAILRSAGRIRDYMEQLRALTAAGGPAEVGGRATAELSALAEGWAAAGRGLCAPRGLRFSLDCPASRPCTLFRSELDRAVLNLLDNAARFTPAGGAVRLSAYVEEAVLTVAVEDSGPGFSPRPWPGRGGLYTGDASRPREGHMGMGLTFARQTARRHGGTLELSNTGRGPGRPSPCPSEEGGAVFRAAFCIFARSALS